MSMFSRLLCALAGRSVLVASAGGRVLGGSRAPAASRRGGLGAGLAAAVVAVCGLLVVGVAPASAATEHVFSFSFGSSGSGAGQLSSPQDVAVNDATGDIYVADTGNRRVDEFNSSGNFVAAWGDDVDQTTGANICTAASGDTCQAGTSSSTPGGFETPEFVAVDNSSGASAGDVYVGDQGDLLVTKFTADGSVVSSWGDGGGSSCGSANGQLSGACASGGPFTSMAGITVDASGNLNVYDDNNDNWFEFAQDGTAVQTVSVGRETDETGIGVDSDGNLYKVVASGHLEQFDSSGNDIGNVTDDESGNQISGFAIDPTTNDIYADDQGGAAGGNSLIRHYLGSSLSSCVPNDDCAAADTFGSGQLSGSAAGVGFDGATGAVYVADPGDQDVAVFAELTLPDVVTEPASTQGSTVTLNGTVNPNGTTITNCQFDYATTAQYDPSASNPYSAGSTVPCSTTPTGSSPAAVSAQLTGLTPGVTYHFRLQASNSDGTTDGSDQTFTIGASITGDSATAIGTSSATLFGGVDPNGTDTSYQFQYGTSPCSSGSCTSVPIPAADLGSGTTSQQVSEQITGLNAGTTYHYRLIAVSGGITSDGPDQTFTTVAATAAACPNASLRTNASAALPDCRAYEQVTPAGSRPYLSSDNTVDYTQASSTGNGIEWVSNYPITGADSDGFYYLSTRGASGWSTTGLIPPQSASSASIGVCWPTAYLSSDLTEEVLADGFDAVAAAASDGGGTCGSDDPPLVSGEPQGQENLFSSATGSGSYQLLDPPLSANATPGNAEFEDASADFGDVVFEDQAQLTSEAIAGGLNLYDSSGGTVHLVSVLPDGTATTATLANGTVYTAGGGISVSAGSNPGAAPFTGAVSSDGSTVFFQGTTGNLYVRLHATEPQSPVSGGSCTDAADACTVQIDASQAGGSGGGGTFQWASADGSVVYFTDGTSAGLTHDTVSGSGTNLYEYEVSTGQLTDLTAGAAADVQGVSGASTDGSYVYFVADGALAAGATAGQPNLYVYHAGTTTFIATLNSSDFNDWNRSGVDLSTDVSPGGQYFAFASVASLTGYDNTDRSSGQPDTEIYLWNASAGKLSCVSCEPSGTPPSGSATAPATESISQATGPGYEPRQVLDDGRVFFDSPNALLPGGSDGQSNVYESEPDGVGSCVQADGCLYLISGGTSTNGSYFYDASASGDDVFFVSTQDLTGSDSDGTGISLYDARVDGGFPTGSGTPVACSSSQTCEGSASSAPSTPSVGSVTFTGPGDQKSTTKTVVGKVEVTKRAVKSDSFRLTVRVPAKGNVAITGTDTKKLARSVGKAGSYKLTVHLTGKAIRELKARRKLKVALKVSYKAARGGSSSVVVSMIVRST